MDDMVFVTSEDNTLQRQIAEPQLKLTGLIEDCLIHIFSLLDDKDLVNCAAVNKQFRVICRGIFRGNNWVDILSAFEEGPDAKEAFQTTKNLLERFGDLILTTYLDYTTVKKKSMRKKVHDLIIEHCSNTLEKVIFCKLNDSLKFTKPFPKVKQLFFHEGTFHHSMREIRKFFPNVEEIRFNYVKGLSWNWGFEPQHIPSLQKFDNDYDCTHFDSDPGWYLDNVHLNHFIASNPQLLKFSASLNSHKCDHLRFMDFLERNFVELPANERQVNDHPMSFKITAQSCGDECNVFDRFIIPYERVESLELCLKNLCASEFIAKCRNIKKLRLYLQLDSHLFNASYFNKIATALPLLEELFLAMKTQKKRNYLSEFLDNPPIQTNEIKYEKGVISALHPFVSLCQQLNKIEFQHSIFDAAGLAKTEFSRQCIADIRDFDKIIRQEQVNWTSSNKEMDTWRYTGYIYKLTK